jgi:hypothetical protein
MPASSAITCNLHSVEEIKDPGTIDQMAADAAVAGHQATVRLIRDWTEAGLLDYPQHRPAGKGRGSRQALYPATQRNLFLTLLHHRSSNRISSLARIPVGIWMYWGDDFVPLRQARRAMNTWIGDPRSSIRRARETAGEMARQLDNPAATSAARRELREALADLAYTARPDFERLEHAVTDVFDAGFATLHRAVGHPAAPAMSDSVIVMLKARLKAIDLLTTGKVTDEDFYAARHAHQVNYAEYAARQHLLAMHAPADNSGMYERVTAESALNVSCGHLLTTIGLNGLFPERASQIIAAPAPAARPWRSVT